MSEPGDRAIDAMLDALRVTPAPATTCAPIVHRTMAPGAYGYVTNHMYGGESAIALLVLPEGYEGRTLRIRIEVVDE